jgi:MFS family permease
MSVVESRTPRTLPSRTYFVWLAAMLVTMAGDAVFYFALGWAATAYGGLEGGAVLTAITLMRTAFLLYGGVLADRVGPRMVMIVCAVSMLILAMFLAVFAASMPVPVWALLVAGLIMGTVDAFYIPASGSMTRHLVDTDSLPRALAMRQVGTQIVGFIGGPIAGVIVATGGLSAASIANAVTFLVVLAVIVAIRPAVELEAKEDRPNAFASARDGLRLAVTDSVLSRTILLVGVVAGFLIPIGALLIPLVVRQYGWGAGTAGLLIGLQGAGTMVVAIAVVARGTSRRLGLVSAIGVLGSAAGAVVLALGSNILVAGCGSVIIGLGTGLFLTHGAPLSQISVPMTHIGRVQSLLMLTQSLILAASTAVLGFSAEKFSATSVLVACGAALALAGVSALVSKPFRNAGLPAGATN